MRNLVLIFAFITCIASANAQQIILKGGAAIPTGNYSNTTTTNSANGFAGTGANIAFRINYTIVKNIGILFETGSSNQSIKQDELHHAIAEMNPNAQITLSEVNGYRSTYSLLGSYFQFPLKRVTLNAEVAIGKIYLNTPSYTITYAYASNTNSDYMNSDATSSLLYCWGIKADYILESGFTLIGFVHNMNALLEVPAGTYTSSTQSYKELNFDVWQIGVGVGYTIK